MSEELSKIVNSPVMWGIALVTIMLVFIISIIYLKKSISFASKIGITNEQLHSAVKTSITSSIGPSVVIMVGMISLLIVVGAPIAMLRLSVIGSVSFELLSATLASNAFGVELSATNMTPQIFQATLFVMAVGCIGYLLLPIFFCNSFDKLIGKLSNQGKNVARATMITTVAILGIYSYINAPYILKHDATTVALIVGFIVMYAINIIYKKTKKKWLLEWGMLIAMCSGMVIAAIC